LPGSAIERAARRFVGCEACNGKRPRPVASTGARVPGAERANDPLQ
jgi:hypothetical protein